MTRRQLDGGQNGCWGEKNKKYGELLAFNYKKKSGTHKRRLNLKAGSPELTCVSSAPNSSSLNESRAVPRFTTVQGWKVAKRRTVSLFVWRRENNGQRPRLIVWYFTTSKLFFSLKPQIVMTWTTATYGQIRMFTAAAAAALARESRTPPTPPL